MSETAIAISLDKEVVEVIRLIEDHLSDRTRESFIEQFLCILFYAFATEPPGTLYLDSYDALTMLTTEYFGRSESELVCSDAMEKVIKAYKLRYEADDITKDDILDILKESTDPYDLLVCRSRAGNYVTLSPRNKPTGLSL